MEISTAQCLRKFIDERLTAAAEEIFGVFEKTIVKYEEEIDRQRRLLDIVWKPETTFHTTELPEHNVCKEEEHLSDKEEEHLSDQQLCIQERNSSLDEEEPEPPQIEEEQEELCPSQEGEQLVLKEETDTFMWSPTYEDSDHSEDQTLNFSPDDALSAAERESVVNIPVTSSVVSEPNSDRQQLYHNSHLAESQDQKRAKQGDPGSTTDAEPKQKRGHHKSSSHCSTHTGKTFLKCDTCGKAFKSKSKLQRHLSTHTGDKPYSCSTCGKSFVEASVLNAHVRIHTGEKPYACKICGKGFRWSNSLNLHMRTHSGEKPYTCIICGKGFRWANCLRLHMRTHSGEKPYTCNACGRDFRSSSNLKDHMRTHTGETLYHCETYIT